MAHSTDRAISDPAQLTALASPVRQEVIDLLARTGPASPYEIGLLLGRPADGLYYHLRLLERVGLVSATGTRVRRGRSEMLFRAEHRQPALRHDTSAGGNSPAVATIVASMLRLGIRDFRRASATPLIRTQGRRRDLWALRVTGWLTPGQLADVNRRMAALRDAVGRPRSKGRLYAITILLTPLEHRARRKQRRPRSAGRGLTR